MSEAAGGSSTSVAEPAAAYKADLRARLARIEADGMEAGRRELDLSDQAVGDEGAEQLARGLAANSSLKRLSLQRSQLTARGLRALGLLLAGGGLAARRREKARHEMRESPELLGGSADALERLVLSGNDCSPGGVPPEFCEGLSLSVSLRTLALGGCSLGDAGVLTLVDILGLQESGTQSACLLQHLDLSQNALSLATARALVPALGTNLHLKSLDLKANELGPEGAEAMADCLRANKGRLQRLDVSQNGIQLVGARALLERFCRPVAFPIQISRPRGTPVGMALDANMRVMGVNPAGLVDNWSRVNPSEAVCAGDIVVRVNDKTSAAEMLEELTEVQELEILLSRPGVGLVYLDVCHNGITLAGVQELREAHGRPAAGSLRLGLLAFEGGRQTNLNAG